MNLFICINLFACMWVYIYGGAYVHIHACMWRPEISCSPFLKNFLDKGFQWCLGWLANEPQGFLWLCCPSDELQTMPPCLFFYVVSWVQTQALLFFVASTEFSLCPLEKSLIYLLTSSRLLGAFFTWCLEVCHGCTEVIIHIYNRKTSACAHTYTSV